MKKTMMAVAIIAALFMTAGCEKENIPESLVYVKGGEFVMGDEELSKEFGWMGKPHTVYVDSFYMSKEEVTQGLYKSIMGENPSEFSGFDRPVEWVSWYEAVEFSNKLSEKNGLTPCYTIDKNKKDPKNKNEDDYIKWTVTCDFNANGYRLPTEAEWEYACRGGAESKGYEYSGSDDLDEVAWWKGNSGKETHPVRSKKPNELGIYDMSGNVWEWCWDWCQVDYEDLPDVNPSGASSGEGRSLRGGSWFNDGRERFLPGFRSSSIPRYQSFSLGFRVCRSFLQVPVARKNR